MTLEIHAFIMRIPGKFPVLFHILFLFLLFRQYTLFGQTNNMDRYINMMHEGVEKMDSGNYKGADEKFKSALRNLDVLPSEICFFFGKNSYFLEQYKQSINWLNKYIELKGTSGQYFNECVEYLGKAEKAYKLVEEVNKQKVQQELSQQNNFDCNGHTFYKCPLCLGEGVLIKPGKLGTLYQTCPFCNGDGKITCDDYKKYLRGELHTND
jgi:hypothetical protein